MNIVSFFTEEDYMIYWRKIVEKDMDLQVLIFDFSDDSFELMISDHVASLPKIVNTYHI